MISMITVEQVPSSNNVLFLAANAVYNERLAIVLGLITLGLGIAAFLSCRTFASLFKLMGAKNGLGNRIYWSFTNYHLYYWWAFGVFLVAHLMVAVLHTGLPRAGDPDAGLHWLILLFGIFSAGSSSMIFASCRVLPRLSAMLTPRDPFSNSGYRWIFQHHAYYWLVFGLLTATHFVVAYNHAGIWPH
jgi:hypothetical protein